jgi:hypothetical protein
MEKKALSQEKDIKNVARQELEDFWNMSKKIYH